jgi:hypothetical protein
MQIREWLVAGVAALLGVIVIWAAIGNRPFAFKLWLPRLLDRRFGRNAARLLLSLLGATLVLLGVYLALREI